MNFTKYEKKLWYKIVYYAVRNSSKLNLKYFHLLILIYSTFILKFIKINKILCASGA